MSSLASSNLLSNDSSQSSSLSVERERLLAGVEEHDRSAVETWIVRGEEGAVELFESPKILTGC